jgi:hypothetical protein
MKVRITKFSGKYFWYNDKIGEIFDVLKEVKKDYLVNNYGSFKSWIAKEDCEIVEQTIEANVKMNKNGFFEEKDKPTPWRGAVRLGGLLYLLDDNNFVTHRQVNDDGDFEKMVGNFKYCEKTKSILPVAGVPKEEIKIKQSTLQTTYKLRKGNERIVVKVKQEQGRFEILPWRNAEKFGFVGGKNSLKVWRNIAELILKAVEVLEEGE